MIGDFVKIAKIELLACSIFVGISTQLCAMKSSKINPDPLVRLQKASVELPVINYLYTCPLCPPIEWISKKNFTYYHYPEFECKEALQHHFMLEHYLVACPIPIFECVHLECLNTEPFNQASKFIAHLRKKHGDKKPFKCPYLTGKNSSFYEKDMIQSSESDEAEIQCNMTFSQKEHMKRHTASHTGVRPIECPHPACTYRFVENCKLERHLRKMHKNMRCSADPAVGPDKFSEVLAEVLSAETST
jgi:hypothetical protein